MMIINNNGNGEPLKCKFLYGGSESVENWLREHVNIRIIKITDNMDYVGIFYFDTFEK